MRTYLAGFLAAAFAVAVMGCDPADDTARPAGDTTVDPAPPPPETDPTMTDPGTTPPPPEPGTTPPPAGTDTTTPPPAGTDTGAP